jgi:hypothetical protein
LLDPHFALRICRQKGLIKAMVLLYGLMQMHEAGICGPLMFVYRMCAKSFVVCCVCICVTSNPFVVVWGSPSLQFDLSFFLDYILKPKSGPGPIINSIDSFFPLMSLVCVARLYFDGNLFGNV